MSTTLRVTPEQPPTRPATKLVGLVALGCLTTMILGIVAVALVLAWSRSAAQGIVDRVTAANLPYVELIDYRPGNAFMGGRDSVSIYIAKTTTDAQLGDLYCRIVTPAAAAAAQVDESYGFRMIKGATWWPALDVTPVHGTTHGHTGGTDVDPPVCLQPGDAGFGSPSAPAGSPSGPTGRYAGRFVLTGSMPRAVQLDTATVTVLQDGRVLVAGGRDHASTGAIADLYDPASGTWESTGSLPQPTRGATAVLLDDGRVLVTGGVDAVGHATATASVYDPRRGTWSPTTPMPVARDGATATRLRDGRILVAGGDGPDDAGVIVDLSTATLYDPVTGTWSPTGSMSLGRSRAAAMVVADGRVLVVGGGGAELYDPATGTFASSGFKAQPHSIPNATLLADGRVLVVGGLDARGYALDSAELFDPRTGTFSATGSMSTVRDVPTVAPLADGRVLVIGGLLRYDYYADSAEIYDPATGTFTPTGSTTVGRGDPLVATLHDGRVLVIGGYVPSPAGYYVPLATAELFQ